MNGRSIRSLALPTKGPGGRPIDDDARGAGVVASGHGDRRGRLFVAPRGKRLDGHDQVARRVAVRRDRGPGRARAEDAGTRSTRGSRASGADLAGAPPGGPAGNGGH